MLPFNKILKNTLNHKKIINPIYTDSVKAVTEQPGLFKFNASETFQKSSTLYMKDEAGVFNNVMNQPLFQGTNNLF